MDYVDHRDITVNFKNYNLGLSQSFLYLEFIFILWIHLSFIHCGLYMDLWFCGLYTNICFCLILATIYKKYTINQIFESILFLFNILWFIGGLFFIRNEMYNECSDNTILQPTIIFYLLSNIMITFAISKNKIN